jgi:GT2 family glycosyltransferase
LIRRDCARQVGGFDTDFFLYYEDVDFCRRARALGWTVWFDPTLAITHHHPLHSRRVPPRIRLLTRHALLTYARKHWPDWQFRATALLVWVESQFRRLRERRRKCRRAAAIFRQQGRIAIDLFRGRVKSARRRLLRIVRDGDGRYRRTEGMAKRETNSVGGD